MGGDFCSSGLPARDLSSAFGRSGGGRNGAGALQGVWLTRRREGSCKGQLAVVGGSVPPHPRPLSPVSRGRGEELVGSVRCSVFSQASRGRESAGARPVRPGCGLLPGSIAGIPWLCGCFAGGRSHAKPRRREGSCKGQWEVVGGSVPPHPRPLSPVSRGRGEILCFWCCGKTQQYPSPLEGMKGMGVRGGATLSPTPWLPGHGCFAGSRSHAKPRRSEVCRQ